MQISDLEATTTFWYASSIQFLLVAAAGAEQDFFILC